MYYYYDSIDSTNNELKRLAEKDAEEFTVVSAGEQTAGRGRSGHVWQSPPGTSVATSIMLRPEGIALSKLPQITILSAMAVADAVGAILGETAKEDRGIAGRQAGTDDGGTAAEVTIKWPNDVLLNRKKLSGILTELCSDGKGQKYVIVGIGVNVGQLSFPDDIADIATSLAIESGKEPSCFDKESIVKKIWESFLNYYKTFLRNGDLSGIRAAYEKRLVNMDAPVKVLDPAGSFEATATGIDDEGRLKVKLSDGSGKLIDSGEVSVRGILGYA